MAQLLSAHQLSHSFSGRTLFKKVGLGISEGDRIGLVGPNGAGKSTLLKILNKKISPDVGEVVHRRNLKIGFLEQTPSFNEKQTILEALAESLKDPHEGSAKVYEWYSKLELDQFPIDTQVNQLSGGWKKRVALGRELIIEPDILFLDEPTNHLDIASILWLEEFLESASFATVIITHDRLFLQRVANKIFDLDPRNPTELLVCEGDYLTYLEQKNLLLEGQKAREKTLKNTLRRETEWLRRGAKARQTKQKGRIQRAHELKDDVQELSQKNKTRSLDIEFAQTENKPKKLIEITDASKSFIVDLPEEGGKHEKILFQNLDLLIHSKSRLGLIGVNGAGKSTLIKCLLGLEPLSTGEIKKADKIEISYFEQNRETLDFNQSVLKNICPDGDYVNDRGQFVHVRSYLERFLFSYQQFDLPVGRLSGGEQSRLRLAQLMLRPASILVLDEPTNDLDVDTLDVLENSLIQFPGAVILVTHDRYFLDQVAKEMLAFPIPNSGSYKLEKFADYLQWESWYEEEIKKTLSSNNKKTESKAVDNKATMRLSYKEKREWDMMEETIMQTEEILEKLRHESGLPEVASNASRAQELYTKIAEAEKKIEGLYMRWSELSEKVKK